MSFFKRYEEKRNKDPELKEIYNILVKNGLTKKTRCGVEMEKPEIFVASKRDDNGPHRIWFESDNEAEWEERTRFLTKIFEHTDFVKVEPAKRPQRIGPRS